MPTRYDVDRPTLAGLLSGEPRFRVDQVWQGLYEQHRSPAELTSLPKSLRARLDRDLPPALVPVAESTADDGQTVKWLWELHDGATIETVLMHYPDRSTVCVSTQAGCAMGCGFCATGQAGFERNLGVGEIVEQVVAAARRAEDSSPPRRLSNVVFMGMGEPLANYDRTWAAVTRIHDDLGMGARHLTLSTVGIVPGIRRLAGEALPVNLAVSLHAANDLLRDELVPINRRYPLATLRDACAEYLEAKNRRLSFEWALIDGVNDRATDAEELAAFARPLRAHVNLIPLNATPGWPTTGTPMPRVTAFRDLLRDLGVNATVRANRGNDIDAACGQLRANHTATPVQLGPRRMQPADPPPY
ncbi:23S rRNA (adenine(2503)-C(2))-methyltransferase RlmN [Rhabdothermincola salaria]|uniref:23S rRNA (adenine(2503)-C(2))-methyltransferase RlmN n=1 Tax=Rhabdothermincola salaria TaxID=2903142 RepID=UPI001E3BB4D1|nr:23S rRNA (adenine(2503)-C(2))-methyltransferase RlmN [Rhabdothermincola salaria]